MSLWGKKNVCQIQGDINRNGILYNPEVTVLSNYNLLICIKLQYGWINEPVKWDNTFEVEWVVQPQKEGAEEEEEESQVTL